MKALGLMREMESSLCFDVYADLIDLIYYNCLAVLSLRRHKCHGVSAHLGIWLYCMKFSSFRALFSFICWCV
jgi:hypothetical protein